MRTLDRNIELKALEVLRHASALRVPVPIQNVVDYLGLSLEAAELGDDVSGVLVVSGRSGAIGFNASQAPVRQRFTIAHECGHFVLHADQGNLFIDAKVYQRNRRSETGEDKREIQANQFAAALLMPKELLAEYIKDSHLDVSDEEAIRSLAELFKVSTQAMSLRLANLRMFAHI
jgi:Zn-dependent peptidase ImmA (M78 family)